MNRPAGPALNRQETIETGEHYEGRLSISHGEGLEEERRPMSLTLNFNAGNISGQATASGFSPLSVTGKVYPRGIELTLSNSSVVLSLSGARHMRSLRGRFSSNSNMRGVWEVNRVN